MTNHTAHVLMNFIRNFAILVAGLQSFMIEYAKDSSGLKREMCEKAGMLANQILNKKFILELTGK